MHHFTLLSGGMVSICELMDKLLKEGHVSSMHWLGLKLLKAWPFSTYRPFWDRKMVQHPQSPELSCHFNYLSFPVNALVFEITFQGFCILCFHFNLLVLDLVFDVLEACSQCILYLMCFFHFLSSPNVEIKSTLQWHKTNQFFLKALYPGLSGYITRLIRS